MFVYALIMTLCTLGLLHVVSCKFVTELWPLINFVSTQYFKMIRVNQIL